jgi:putative phosphoesterase
LRLGLISDIHGNPIAFEACLRALDRLRLDELYFLGDASGYIPGEARCLSLLDDRQISCQLGNHEEMLLSGEPIERDDVYGLEAVRSRLDAGATERIGSWPRLRTVELDGRQILLVHGSPKDPLHDYVYPDGELSSYADPAHDAIVMGHTHRPFQAQVGGTTLVNVGSVGLPRDVGRLASFAVYDSDQRAFAIYRVAFDTETVLTRWGEQMHQTTQQCLQRTARTFVGELIG